MKKTVCTSRAVLFDGNIIIVDLHTNIYNQWYYCTHCPLGVRD